MQALRKSKLVKATYWTGACIALAAIALSAANKISASQGLVPYKTVVGLNIYPVAALVTIGALLAVVLVGFTVSLLLRNRDSRLLEAEMTRIVESRRRGSGA